MKRFANKFAVQWEDPMTMRWKIQSRTDPTPTRTVMLAELRDICATIRSGPMVHARRARPKGDGPTAMHIPNTSSSRLLVNCGASSVLAGVTTSRPARSKCGLGSPLTKPRG